MAISYIVYSFHSSEIHEGQYQGKPDDLGVFFILDEAVSFAKEQLTATPDFVYLIVKLGDPEFPKGSIQRCFGKEQYVKSVLEHAH